MPVGVDVTTATRSGPTGNAINPAAAYFVVGQTERGPADQAVVCYSLADYLYVFGDRVPYGTLYDDLRDHFEEQGSMAVVGRVVGAGAGVGTLTLKDTNVGTAANTLRIDSRFPGARSTGVTVAIVAGSATGKYTLNVYLDGVLVETYVDLTSPADAQNMTGKSWFIKVTDLGSGTTAPANNPAVVAATALSAGSDDRGSITGANYVAALARFGETAVDRAGNQVLLGAGVVAIPGQSKATIGVGLAAHCVSRHRLGLVGEPVGVAQATGQANTTALIASLGSTGGLEFIGAVNGGVTIPDAGGIVRTVDSPGYVAAARARAINAQGPERSPIGAISEAQFVMAPELPVDRAGADLLDGLHMIPLRVVAGSTRVYGWRSLSSDPNYKLLKDRDLLNDIQWQAQSILEDELGDVIDGSGQLAARVKARMIGLLDPIAKRGGLYPLNGDPGYSVDVGATINTLALAAQDTLGVVLGVRISPTAEKIQLTIIKAALAANL